MGEGISTTTEAAEDASITLTVRVSPETMLALETMAEEQRKDMPVLVRDATAVAYAIHKELRAGGEIVVERRRGRSIALLFDWFTENAGRDVGEGVLARRRRSR